MTSNSHLQKTTPTSRQETPVESGFSFVAVDPNADHHRSSGINIVRSNAVKWQWKQSKAVRARGRKTRIPKAPTVPSGRQTNADAQQIAHDQRPRNAFSSNSAGFSNRIEWSQTVSPARALVPHSYPSPLPTDVVAPLLHQGQQCPAPHMMSLTFAACEQFATIAVTDVDGLSSPAVSQLAHFCLSHSGLLHAVLWATSCNTGQAGALTKFGPDDQTLDFCYSFAVQSAREMVSTVASLAASTRRETMLNLFLVANMLSSEPKLRTNIQQQAVSGPRQSPLTQLQALHVWGSGSRYTNIHADAVRRLANSDELMPVLGVMSSLPISYPSIIFAARELQIPWLPYYPLNANFHKHFQEYRAEWESALKPRSHARRLTAVLPSGLGTKLAPIVHDIVIFMHIHRMYLLGRLSDLRPSFVADARNWIQHQVSSLPVLPIPGPQGPILIDNRLYEAIRLSLLAFSLISIFPLAPASAPFHQLAGSVLDHVGHLSNTMTDVDRAHLLIWIATIGGLASIGSTLRPSFVELIANLIATTGVDKWDDARTLLLDHLWDPDISDLDGQLLWLEVAANRGSPSSSWTDTPS
jgi:hypothetical protein